MLDEEKQRREFMRWVLLRGLYNAEPVGAWEEVLLSIILALYVDATKNEVRRALDYLGERGLVHLTKRPDGRWFGKLARTGTDLVEYAVDCEPGIARPVNLG